MTSPAWQYIVKVILTAAVVVAVAEVGKRSSFWGRACVWVVALLKTLGVRT